MEMGSMIQSIKESTARNIQTLFDVSSINENSSSCSKQQQEQHCKSYVFEFYFINKNSQHLQSVTRIMGISAILTIFRLKSP